MNQQFRHIMILAGTCIVGLTLCLILSLFPPFVNPANPYVLFRYCLLRLVAALITIPILVGAMIAIDYITPSNWMDCIGDDGKSCAYIMAAIVLVLGAILCWA